MRLIFFSLLVGLSLSFYHLVGIARLGGQYSPLALNQQSPPFATDETVFYAIKVGSFLNGNWRLGDVLISEYAGEPSPFVGEWLPTAALAGLSRLVGNVERAFMLADFIFPALTFYLLAQLFICLTRRPDLAPLVSLGTMLFSHYLTYFPYLPSALAIASRALISGSYSPFIRSFHPQVTFPLLVLFLIWFFKKRWLLAAGSAAALAYSHWFYFSFALMLLVINFLVKKMPLKPLILMLVLSLPYFLSLYFFQQAGYSSDFLSKISFYQPPSFSQISLIITAWLLLVLVFPKSLRSFWLLVYGTITLLTAGAVLLRFDLDDPIGHWFLRLVEPLTFLLICVLVGQKIKRLSSFWAYSLFGLLLLYQTTIHWQYFRQRLPAFYLEPEKQEMFAWLNQNTPKNSVVATAGLKDNLYLAVFTHNFSFIPRAQLSLAPTAEAVDRFLMAQKLAGKSAAEIAGMFANDQGLQDKKRFDFDNCAGIYLFFRQYAASNYYNCSIPQTVLDLLLEQYQKTEPDLTGYRADYWLGADYVDFGQLLWENQAYKVYALNQDR